MAYHNNRTDAIWRLIPHKYPTHQVKYGCVKFNTNNDGGRTF
jgi:hypothetical protein